MPQPHDIGEHALRDSADQYNLDIRALERAIDRGECDDDAIERIERWWSFMGTDRYPVEELRVIAEAREQQAAADPQGNILRGGRPPDAGPRGRPHVLHGRRRGRPGHDVHGHAIYYSGLPM